MRRSLVLAIAAAALAACAPPPAEEALPGPGTAAVVADTAAPAFRTAVYRCDGEYRFTALAGVDSARLFLPERTTTLPLVISASGARYSDGAVTYWSKGDEALLEVDGASHDGCTLDPIWEAARDRGVAFRATGDEPGWALEVTPGDSIRFTYDYGDSSLAVPTPEPSVNARGYPAYFARTADAELSFAIEPRPCTGTMAAEAFANTVIVTLERGDDFLEFHGCGNPLQ